MRDDDQQVLPVVRQVDAVSKPIWRAIASRPGLTSATTVRVEPAYRATCATSSPMGPAPTTMT